MSSSRRSFLSSLSNEFQGIIPSWVTRAFEDNKSSSQTVWRNVGKLSRFKSGLYPVSLAEQRESIFVEALPEGVRVFSTSGRAKIFFATKMELGQIFFNPTSRWQANEVLSILTGERVIVDVSKE